MYVEFHNLCVKTLVQSIFSRPTFTVNCLKAANYASEVRDNKPNPDLLTCYSLLQNNHIRTLALYIHIFRQNSIVHLKSSHYITNIRLSFNNFTQLEFILIFTKKTEIKWKTKFAIKAIADIITT